MPTFLAWGLQACVIPGRLRNPLPNQFSLWGGRRLGALVLEPGLGGMGCASTWSVYNRQAKDTIIVTTMTPDDDYYCGNLRIRKLRHRTKINLFCWMASKWQSRDSNLGGLAPGSMLSNSLPVLLGASLGRSGCGTSPLLPQMPSHGCHGALRMRAAVGRGRSTSLPMSNTCFPPSLGSRCFSVWG